jgi:hypothetical protein
MVLDVSDIFKKHCDWAMSVGYDPHGDNCLDIAVGFAEALRYHNYKVAIILLVRDDEFNVHEILSHVMVKVGDDIIDGYGPDANRRWVRDFNMIQRANGDDEATFDEEVYTKRFLSLYDTCRERFAMCRVSPVLMETIYNRSHEFIFDK